MIQVHPKRIFTLKNGTSPSGPVVYWMSRDQRARDNWALLHAETLALERKTELLVVFCLSEDFPGATRRAYGFMLNGLRQVENELRQDQIPFYLIQGDPGDTLPEFIRTVRAGILVADFDPLRIKKEWKSRVLQGISIPFHEVDAHNIVPCKVVSQKQEYGARTLRLKILRELNDFLEPFPDLISHPFVSKSFPHPVDWDHIGKSLKADRSVPEVDWIRPGSGPALDALQSFIRFRLSGYAVLRNDPTKAGQSDLSPYIHFGQLSAQRAALEVEAAELSGQDKSVFLDELIVRRELSDNYCQYNAEYDSLVHLPHWARETLEIHRPDMRAYLYSEEEFERASTHDPLWNAAQREMMIRGKMHGYMRMYWAKKLLEWTRDPEEAFRIAVFLNDKYSLDGRDPNGYAGIAWSIGGVHDRPWFDRPVYGKIRMMSRMGAGRKFDTGLYINQWIHHEGEKLEPDLPSLRPHHSSRS